MSSICRIRFRITEAEFKGRLARVNRERIGSNPYPVSTREWRDFAKGWVYADHHPGVPRFGADARSNRSP